MYHFLLKVSLVGASNVGKSSLLKAEDSLDEFGKAGGDNALMFMSKPLPPLSTLETKGSSAIQFKTKEYLLDDYTYRVQYWDCPGSDKYLNLTSKYCAGSTGTILVFSLNDSKSFEKISEWLAELEENGDKSVRILVGNKLHAGTRQVPASLIEKFAKNHRLQYIETDAKQGINCEQVFRTLFLEIVNTIPFPPEPRDLDRKGIKIGPSLLADKKYKHALYNASQKTNEEDQNSSSYFMDWL